MGSSRQEGGDADIDEAMAQLRVALDPCDRRAALARMRARLFRDGKSPELRRYRLGRELGRGGRGIVFAAFDTELAREVAIKFVRSSPRDHDEVAASLQREARALARLSHPNVVHVFEVSTSPESAGGMFLVVELIEGCDLRSWLLERPRSRRQILQVFLAAGRGLAAAHEAGIVHRDFKPENVLIARDGRVKVADFGLARPGVSRSGGDRAGIDGAATCAGMGTPVYMAPEQHARRVVDARADQYAFCVALFEALSQRPPFSGRTLEELEQAKREATLQRPATIPRWLWRVLARGLRPHPQHRHEHMLALLHRLETGSSSVRRSRQLGALAVLSVAAVVTSPLSAGEQCHTAATLGDDWRTHSRAVVVEAFASMATTKAEATSERLLQQLDTYAESWTDVHMRACAEPQPAAKVARVECLHAAKRRFVALTEALQVPDPAMLDHVGPAVAALPDPDHCERQPLQALALATGGTPSSEAEESWQILDRAMALADLGRYSEAEDLAVMRLEQLPETAAAARAAAHLVLGEVEGYRNAFERAAPHFEQALFSAELAGDDVRWIAALMKLAVLTGHHLHRTQEAKRLLGLADARLRRVGAQQPSLQRAELEHIHGLVDAGAEDFESAIGHHGTALRLHEQLLGRDHPETAEVLLSLGAAHISRGALVEARPLLEEATAIYGEWFGPQHPLVGHCLGNLGYLAEREQRHDDALALHERALRIHQTAVGERHPWIGRSLLNIGRTLRNLGQHEASERRLHEALRVFTALEQRERVASVWVELGQLHAERRETDEAVAAYREALEIWDGSPEGEEVAVALRSLEQEQRAR